jgi:cytoskeletal protein CcmA (bactofilin family)
MKYHMHKGGAMSFFSGSRRQHEENADRKQTDKKDDGQSSATQQAPRRPVGFETVLGANSILNGALRSQANVRLDGSFEGSLEIDGNVLVGETGKIKADINARNIVIAGAVRGNVNGNKVQLLRTSRVWGDISAAAITTEEGAFIDGKITMVKHEASSQMFEIAASFSTDALQLSGTRTPQDDDDDISAMTTAAKASSVSVKDVKDEPKNSDDDIEVIIGEPVDDDEPD